LYWKRRTDTIFPLNIADLSAVDISILKQPALDIHADLANVLSLKLKPEELKSQTNNYNIKNI